MHAPILQGLPKPTLWTVALAIWAIPAISQDGPGSFEIDEEAAERALERALVQTGSVLLPFGSAEVVPFFSYRRAEEQTAGGPLIVDGDLVGSSISTERDEFRSGVTVRAGLPWAAQVDLTLPYVSTEQSTVQTSMGTPIDHGSADLSGLGDVRLAYTQSLTGNDPTRANILATVAWDTDTGTEEDGRNLGSGFDEVELSLATTTRQDPLVISGRIGFQRSFESDGVQPGDQFTLSGSTFLAVNPETSLQLGMSLSYSDDIEFEGNTIDGSDRLAATLDLGLATILGRNSLLDTTFNIGLTEDAPDFGVSVSVPLRLSF